MALPTRRADNSMTQFDPMDEFTRLTQQLSGLFDDRIADIPAILRRDGFVPSADVEETDDAYVLDVELPGVKKDAVTVDVTDRHLVIAGERVEKERAGRLRQRTRAVGNFRYEVVLPNRVDEDHVEASLHDGVLHVVVPKAQMSTHKRIEVK
jgi:HSP20 family protein